MKTLPVKTVDSPLLSFPRKATKTPALRILYLEDNPASILRIKRIIETGEDALAASMHVVETKDAFTRELKRGTSDLILCKRRIKGYDGLKALKAARTLCPEIPVIMLPGKLGETRAIEMLKLGAADYVLEGNLKRLPSSIRHALRDAALEKERLQVETRYRALAESINDGFWAVDSHWCFTYLNARAAKIFGYAPEDLIGKNLWDTFFRIRNTLHEKQYRKVMLERSPSHFKTTGITSQHTYAISAYPSGDGISIYWQDITDRKRAKEELRRQAELMNLSPDATMTLTRNGFIRFWSKGAERLYGWTHEEAIGKNCHTLLKTVFSTPPEVIIKELVQQTFWSGELLHTAKDGRQVVVQSRWIGLPAEHGGIAEILESNIDITEQKRIEEARRKSEELAQERLRELEVIYRTAPVGLCLLDRNLRWQRINDALAEVNGLPPEAHIGKTPRELLPDFAEQTEAAMKRVLETGEPLLNVEFTGRTPSQPGVIRSFNERWLPWKDSQGNIIGISVAAEETTEWKRLIAALSESEERFRTMADSTPVMIWATNARGDIEMANHALEEFFGMSEAQIKSPDIWSTLLHPEDTSRYLADFARALESQSAFDFEGRFLHYSGEWRWLHSYGAPRFGSDGEFLGHVGSSPDVTAQKLLEENLQRSEENLRLMVEASTEPMMVVEAGGAIEAISGAGAHLLGYQKDELVGHKVWELANIPSLLELSFHLREIRKHAPEPFAATYRVRTKNGGVEWMTVQASLASAREAPEKYLLKFQRLGLPAPVSGEKSPPWDLP